MIATRVLLPGFLIALVLVGCTAVPNPTPTAENPAGGVATLEATRPMPTAQPTTLLVSETAVTIPTLPPVSTNTPQPTPLVLPSLEWSPIVTPVTTVDSWQILWSPTANEFVFDSCADTMFPPPDPLKFNVSSAPDFGSSLISFSDIFCPILGDYIWHPDGQQIIFSGTNDTEIDNFFSDIWIMTRQGQGVQNFDRVGKYIEFRGWMDDTTLVYRDHWGAANWQVYILDVNTNTEIASAFLHASGINALTPDFVISGDGMQSEGPFSAAALAREIVAPNNSSPYLKLLSRDPASCCLYLFNSSSEELLPDSNQVLVRTWDASAYLTDTIHTPTDLQLWNLETDELTFLIPGGLFGSFSPDGQYLVYTLYGTVPLQLELLNRKTDEIILRQTVASYTGSFSPDGRTLTFFSSTPELMLYDLETDEFLPPLTAVPYTTFWSPNSSRFVYKHPINGLSIFDLRTHTTYPLAASGSERLSNLQWSYDGTYLSVTIDQEDGSRDTAVLQIP